MILAALSLVEDLPSGKDDQKDSDDDRKDGQDVLEREAHYDESAEQDLGPEILLLPGGRDIFHPDGAAFIPAWNMWNLQTISYLMRVRNQIGGR